MFIQIYVLSRPGIGNNALFGKNRGAFVTGIPSIIMKPIANGLVSSPSTTQPTKGKKDPYGYYALCYSIPQWIDDHDDHPHIAWRCLPTLCPWLIDSQ